MRLKIPFTLLMTLLFILVLGVYVRLQMVDYQFRANQHVEKNEATKLYLLEEGDSVTRIWIQNPAEPEPVVLEKKDGRWRITEPVDYPAEPKLSEGMITALTASVKVRNLRREGEWSEYGLDKPKLEVKVRTEKSPEDRSLYFGNQSPTSGLVFARWVSASDEYFLLPDAIRQVFSKSLYSLRAKNIFDGSGLGVMKVHVRTPQGDFEISRHKNQWFWMEPIPILGEIVSAEELKVFWSALEHLYVKEFVDGPYADLASFGIRDDGPAIKVTEGENETAKEQILQIGNEVPEKQAFYAKREHLENPYLVASPNLNRIFEQIQSMAAKAAPQTDVLQEGGTPGLTFENAHATLQSEPSPEPAAAEGAVKTKSSLEGDSPQGDRAKGIEPLK